MILLVKMLRMVATRTLALSLALCVIYSRDSFLAQKKDNLQKPIAGPRATALRVTALYVTPSLVRRKLIECRLAANWSFRTRAAINGSACLRTPTLNWNTKPTRPSFPKMKPRLRSLDGCRRRELSLDTPNGDQILMGAAADQESLASDPRGPVNAARTAHLLYRRLVEMFPNSPFAAEAAWRSADILWQIQKSDASSRPSAKERESYLRDQMDEDGMKKVIKFYPHTRQADLAAYALIDNKLCGDWQGQPNALKRNLNSTRSLQPSTPTDDAPPRPCIRPHIDRRC